MKILITSGGTSQPIDRVRSITNHASGRLGAVLAQEALKRGHQVTLLTTKTAIKPDGQEGLTILEIATVEELLQTMESLVKNHQILIHSMAVSDYTPVYMTDLNRVKNSPNIEDLLQQTNTEKKISSTSDIQVLFLQKTPKIISLVKRWNPQIQLVGFKLLVDVSKEELLAVARDSLVKNQADYILANDLMDISHHAHKAYLVSHQDVLEATTKAAIARLILTTLEENSHG